MYRRNASSLTDSSQNNSYLDGQNSSSSLVRQKQNKSMRLKRKVSRVGSRLSRPRAVASRSARNKKRSRVLKRALMLATAGAGTYYAFTRKNDNTTTPPPTLMTIDDTTRKPQTRTTPATPVPLSSPLAPVLLVSTKEAICKDTTHLVLQNHGNTCYINASVQLLYQIDEIRDFICDYEDTSHADAFMSILKATFTKKTIEYSIRNIISDKFSDQAVHYNSITGEQVQIQFLPGKTGDAQELLGKIFEFTVLGQINSIGCSLQEELEFVVWHEDADFQATMDLLNQTSEYKVVAATQSADYTTFRKVNNEIGKQILTVPVTVDKTSMQRLLDDFQSPGDRDELVVAEYENENETVKVKRQGTTRTFVVECKKWIIISLHKQHSTLKLDDATVYNNITLEDKQYTLEGCIQHLGCHYKYHKRLAADEWLTFNDSTTEATRADQIASSYVFLYKHLVE